MSAAGGERLKSDVTFFGNAAQGQALTEGAMSA
jgi:hypothetical protein